MAWLVASPSMTSSSAEPWLPRPEPMLSPLATHLAWAKSGDQFLCNRIALGRGGNVVAAAGLRSIVDMWTVKP